MLAPIARAQLSDRVQRPWPGHSLHRRCTKASAAQPQRGAPERGLLSSDIDQQSVLEIEHIRGQLQAQESPFAETNNWGGGCALQTKPELLHINSAPISYCP